MSSRTQELILQELQKNGYSYAEAFRMANNYPFHLIWKRVGDGNEWKINLPVVVLHRPPFKDEYGREWQDYTNTGELDGLIIYPEFKDGMFLIGEEEFSLEEIFETWYDGSSLEFYRPGYGWVRLESLWHLPPNNSIPLYSTNSGLQL